jgi:hypothetical protein
MTAKLCFSCFHVMAFVDSSSMAKDHYTAQVETISDALQELMCDGPEKAQDGLVQAVKDWYDYHYQEMHKWKLLEEMLKSSPS